jgi:hypothetical protein
LRLIKEIGDCCKVDLIKIDIVFENCDSISLHRDVISSFVSNDIIEESYLVSNSFLVRKRIGRSCLSLKKSLVKFSTTNFGSNLLERLEKYKDITSYHVHLSDGSVIEYLLPWGEDDYHNDLEYHKDDIDNININHRRNKKI